MIGWLMFMLIETRIQLNKNPCIINTLYCWISHDFYLRFALFFRVTISGFPNLHWGDCMVASNPVWQFRRWHAINQIWKRYQIPRDVIDFLIVSNVQWNLKFWLSYEYVVITLLADGLASVRATWNKLPKYLNQCWLNQMIIIHMIQDESLFYINYQKTSTRRLCIRHYIPELLTKNTWMFNWKARYTFIQCFFPIVWKITIFRIIMKIA